MEKNEKIIRFWDGIYEFHNSLAPQADNQRFGGIIVLTNQRIACIEQKTSGGFFRTSVFHSVSSNIRLEDIKGISIGDKNWTKFVAVSDAHGNYMFYFTSPEDAFQTKIVKKMIHDENEYASIREAIYDLVRKRKEELEAQKIKDKTQLVLDFSFLKTYMEKGGLNLQTLKCPECGAPIRMPESGNTTNCSHCGNTIYAQDIMEKVKALIG